MIQELKKKIKILKKELSQATRLLEKEELKLAKEKKKLCQAGKCKRCDCWKITRDFCS